jgi:hypothetical protein
MKSPPVQHHDDIARQMTEDFIREANVPLPNPKQEEEVLEKSNGHKIEAATD